MILFLPNNEIKNELHQFSFFISRIDETIRKPDWQINKVSRPYDVFWYVLSGEKAIIVNGVQYIVKKGDLVVFPSQTSFEIIKSDNHIPMHHLEIAIENRLGPFNLTTLYDFQTVTPLESEKNEHELVSLWQELIAHWTPEIRNPYLCQDREIKFGLDQTIDLIYFNSIISRWFVTVLKFLRPKTEELSPVFDSRLQHLLNFINENISKNLSLKILSNEIFLSESHLSLLFRTNLKIAPMEYVRKMRLKRASELLLTSNLSIKEISELIGFDNQSQLSRAFQQTIGVSPTRYRKQSDFI